MSAQNQALCARVFFNDQILAGWLRPEPESQGRKMLEKRERPK